MTPMRAAVAAAVLAVPAFGALQVLTAAPAAAQEYRCCNVPKKNWLPGMFTEARCTAMPKHEPEMDGYDGWKVCSRGDRGGSTTVITPNPQGGGSGSGNGAGGGGSGAGGGGAGGHGG